LTVELSLLKLVYVNLQGVQGGAEPREKGGVKADFQTLR
jgi:hypothetical protein